MKEYRAAMEYCLPPSDFAARLEERVLAVEPNEQKRIIRPLSFAKKVLLAAMLAAVLTATVSAAVLVKWNEIFTDRFGQTPEEVPAAETLFQRVDAESACGDVTLRITEALGDSQTIYFALEYQLPKGTDIALVQRVWESEHPGHQVYLPTIEYYGTGDVSWSEYEAEMGHWWPAIDWRPQTEGVHSAKRNKAFYMSLPHPLSAYDFKGGATAGVQSVSFDAETGTMRFLAFYNSDRGDLTAQPLTALVYPPAIKVEGEDIVLANHPALITFQPAHTARAKVLEAREENCRLRISLSPFSVNVEYYGREYDTPGQLAAALTLVDVCGEELPLTSLSMGSSGSYGGGNVTYRAQFDEILNTAEVAAVRLGGHEFPLE